MGRGCRREGTQNWADIVTLADASLVAAAEARGDRCIFTIDSDFYIYQWNGHEPFEVLK